MLHSQKQYERCYRQYSKLLTMRRLLASRNHNGRHTVDLEHLDQQIEECRVAMRLFRLTSAGCLKFPPLNQVSRLSCWLIQARMLVRISRSELAHKSGLSPGQIQRYEASNYATASYRTLKRIAEVLLQLHEQRKRCEQDHTTQDHQDHATQDHID